MLISVCQGTFNGASACLWRCNTNCKLHSDEGRGRLPFLLSMAVCAFVRRGCNFIATRCKGCAFAFVRCYCLRVVVRVCVCFVCAGALACTLARCLRLFICRLRGFYCFCNTLSTLHAFARLCGLYCSRVCCSLFCAPPVRKVNEQRCKDG